jgi:glutamate carboxypeptidase
VFLVGHTDTVHPPGTFEGFRREGDRGYGPGSFDMKGGIAVMLFGLAAAKRAQLLERVPLRGVLVGDEEAGSPESQAVTRAHAAGAGCALCFESGRPGDLLIPRRKGVGSVKAETRGVAAHSGNEPEKGRSAIWSLARFIDRAQGLTSAEHGVTVNVGTVSGGTTKNTIPAHAQCEVDLRFERSEDGHALVQALEAIAAEVAIPGTSIELGQGSWRDPLERTPASSVLAKQYGECQRESGLGLGEAPLAGGGSDACTLGAMGIPTVDGLGPRGKAFHTSNEEVDLSSLVPKAMALLRFLAKRAGG